MERREFLRLSASVAAFSAGATASSDTGGPRPGVFTAVALSQDCAFICRGLDSIAAPVKSALAMRVDVVALGDVLPSGGRRLTALLGSKDDSRIALALGYLIHRAASQVWAPADGGVEAAVYQDASLIRQISPAARQADMASLNALLRDVGRRLMIGIHTFEPDAEDVENWIVRLIDWDERTNRLYSEYARASAQPDPAKLARYVESVKLYDSGDAAIVLASQLRHGARVPSPELRKALSIPAAGLYGKALRQAAWHVQVASDYVAGKLEDGSFRAAVSLG